MHLNMNTRQILLEANNSVHKYSKKVAAFLRWISVWWADSSVMYMKKHKTIEII